MMDMEQALKQMKQETEERRRKEEEERQNFFKKCSDKIRDGEFIYNLLATYIAKRFRVDIECCHGESPVYAILNHYVDNVEEDFLQWIHKDNAPYIIESSKMPVIFHEFKQLGDNKKIMEMANKVYNLNLEYCNDDYGDGYVFAYEFDFNSFSPINIDEVIELKREIDVLKKYNHDTSELESKLKDFNLPQEILDVI